MIEIDRNLSIDEKYIKMDFIKATGPGGQNVNKVSTAVQLRFSLDECDQLNPEQKERVRKIAGKKLSNSGVLIINARRFRTQEMNRIDAIDRLKHILLKAMVEKKIRRNTKPSKKSIESRLIEKKKIAEKKRRRRIVKDDEF